MGKKIASIDIGKSSLKIVVVEKNHHHIYVKNFLEKKIKEKELIKTIKDAVKEIRVKPDITVVSLPTQLATVRKISLPFKDKNKIQKIIKFEIQPFTLLPPEEIALDFYPIVEKKEETQLLVCGIEKKFLTNLYQNLVKLHLAPQYITLDCFALFKIYTTNQQYPSQKTVALVDIEEERILIDVIKGEKLIALRSIPCTEDFSKEVIFSLRMFELELGEKIEEVLLIQSIPCNEREKRFLSQKVNIKDFNFVNYGSNNLERKELVEFLRENKQFSLGVGLSFIGLKEGKNEEINFYPEIFTYKTRQQLRKNLFWCLILSSMVIISLFIQLYTSLFLKEKRLHHIKVLTRKIFHSTFPEVKNIVNERIQMHNKIKEIKTFLGGLENLVPAASPLTILRELSIRIPKRLPVNIEEIDIEGQRIKIRGRTNKPLAVKGIVRELKSSDYFKDIVITKNEPVEEKIYFEISIKVK